MSHYPQHGFSDEVIMDRLAQRHAHRDTYGSAALHGLDPCEIVARMEDARLDPVAGACREREALRNEVFAGFIEYCFCDGPAPSAVRLRIHGFIESFSPETAAGIAGPLTWITRDAVRAVLRKPAYRAKLREIAASRAKGSLSAWWKDLSKEVDSHCVTQTIVAIVRVMISQGASWKAVVATAYSLAKAFHPHLIAGMSLEDIAILSGDAGRATPSGRIKRIYNRRLEDAGAKSTSVPFQKSESTVCKYQLAQMGNNNRAKNKRRRKKP